MKITPKHVFYSTRKTISLKVNEEGELIVRCPKKVSLSYIENLIARKTSWILEKKKRLLEALDFLEEKFDGKNFLYLGTDYAVNFIENCSKDFFFKDGLFIKNDYKNKPKEIIAKFYQQNAKDLIFSRVEFFSKKHDFKYTKLRLSNAKGHFGSCNSKNTLSFSWRLMMAPIDVIDYVVVHELSHILQKNHSKKFWNLVEEILPNYKESRKWLKENGKILMKF